MTSQEALEIYKLQHSRFQKSQELQWKFNIAMWTFIAASIYFVDNRKHLPHHTLFNDSNVVILIILWGLLHRQFVRLNQRALGVSKAIWEKILRQLEMDQQKITIDVEDVSKQFKFKPRDKKWMAFQISATVVLLIVFLLVYFQS